MKYLSSYDLFLDVGEIQLIEKEYLVTPNSYEIEVAVERSHLVKEKVEVKWKLVSNEHFHLSNGTIFFNDENDQKVIKLDLNNVARNLSTKIELYEPSNGFQLGENKVVNISFVSKFVLKFMQINKKISNLMVTFQLVVLRSKLYSPEMPRSTEDQSLESITCSQDFPMDNVTGCHQKDMLFG